MYKTAFVTGASSGIGKATAILLAKNGYQVVIAGRRRHYLLEIEKQIKEFAPCLSISFDISLREDVERAYQRLPQEWKTIDLLVNNAGLAAGLAPIHSGDINDWEEMINTNVKGLLYLSRLIIPGMVERKSGHIVNISSIAGKEVYANGNVYCATKHAVDAISKAMRIDLLEHNIKVTNIAPGMVETEFSLVRFKGNKEKASKVYENIEPLYSQDVAEAIIFAVSRPAHVNINDMLIMPTIQANSVTVNRDKK